MAAAAPAVAAAVPAIQSPIRPPAPTGVRPGKPRLLSEPHQLWRVNSVAGRLLQGPPRPKGEIDTSETAGFTACRASGPKPSDSATPGSHDSITRSAVATRDSTRARPSAVAGSATTLRWPAWR